MDKGVGVKKRCAIALIDSKWSGHHPTYFKEFTTSFLSLCREVVVICPDPDSVDDHCSSNGMAINRGNMMKWSPPRVSMRPHLLKDKVNKWLEFRWLIKTLKTWENNRGSAISLVFFTCLYEDATIPYNFPWNWSGLLLHCRAFRMPGTVIPYTNKVPDPSKLLQHPRMSSIGTLDEGAAEFLSGLSKKNRIVVMPDFVDTSLPLDDGDGLRLIQFASGRKIVGCLGHLQPTKGITTLAEVALDPANVDICFAFIGNLMLGLFTAEEQSLIQRLEDKENVFVDWNGPERERDFNSIVRACDILFAAYHDFPHSSNIIGKAAFFRKPVIVSQGFLMAERVQHYCLGLTVAERSPEAVRHAIRQLLNDSQALGFHEGCEAYCENHSKVALRNAIASIDQLSSYGN